MARNATLEKLLNDFRAECRLSLNAAHNNQTRDSHIIMLQRKQEWLWEDFDWPHMRVERFIDLQAGQRYYAMPEDLAIDRIQRVEVRHDAVLGTVKPGIYAENYAAYDSELDQRSWPIQRWQITEDEQLEVWPIPDGNFDATTLEGRIKITGIKNLRPLVSESDRADLDDRLIVLHAAAEYLAGTGAQDAQVKLDLATKLYGKLRGSLQARKVFSMFGVGQDRRVRKVPIAVYNKTS